MKPLFILLIGLLFSFTASACDNADGCCEKASEAIEVFQYNNSAVSDISGEHGCCNGFCNCLCCTLPTILTETIIRFEPTTFPIEKRYNQFISNPAIEAFYPIWQPPKI